MTDVGASTWSEIDASNNATPPAGWPEGMQPSDVNNSARANMGGLKRWWDRGNATLTSGGATTAFTLTYAVAAAAYYDGEITTFVADRDCVAGATMNINAIAPHAVNKFSAGVWAAVEDGDWLAGQIVSIRYKLSDTTFQLVGASGSGFVTVDGNNTFTGTNAFTGKTSLSQLIVAGGSDFVPQGRPTLATGVPVMISAQTAKTVVFYTPYCGNLIPLYDGSQLIATPFAELSNDLTQSSTGKAGPAAAAANKIYDLFVWNDAATIRLTRGPLWTGSDPNMTRGTGAGTSELQMVNGLWTNKVTITNGPGANLGTYVGTIRTDGSSQANWQLGGVGAGGTAALLNVWSAYNRVLVEGFVGDSTDAWSYSSATVRAADNSNGNRVSFVSGLQEDSFEADYTINFLDPAGSVVIVGIGYDVTNAFSGRRTYAQGAGSTFGVARGDHRVQAIGFHFMQACEYVNSGSSTNWYGDNGGGEIQSGLTYRGRF